MNGNLLARLVESAMEGNIEKVRLLTNMLSSELQATNPALSERLTRASASRPLRGADTLNPHNNPISVPTSNHFVQTFNVGNVEMPSWDANTAEALAQIVAEREQVEKLIQHGLEPTRTVLFVGPPGVGKTLSATWLASALRLPLKVLDLASVMSSFLGKTGNNLKAVFDDAASAPCILLLDEFDAIAKNRGDEVDIGELKRLVTVLLQTLDNWPSTSLLIAATNHPELLDSAIWRRFDHQVKFPKPNDQQIEIYLKKLTGDYNISKFYALFRGYSYSEIRTIIERSKRYCVINDANMVQHLLNMFVNSGIVEAISREERKDIAKHLVLEAKISQRKVSNLLNMSRPMVRNAVES